jgi:glyceraldehyde-3-phosphate dehydrogenase/erythrose-4-phosphate dehydrogenase
MARKSAQSRAGKAEDQFPVSDDAVKAVQNAINSLKGKLPAAGTTVPAAGGVAAFPKVPRPSVKVFSLSSAV